PRGAPLRPPRRRGSHLANARPTPTTGELLHPRVDRRPPSATVQAYPRRGARDRRSRQRPRGRELAGRAARKGGDGGAAPDSRGSAWREARGLSVAVLGRERVDPGAPESSRVPVRQLADGE